MKLVNKLRKLLGLQPRKSSTLRRNVGEAEAHLSEADMNRLRLIGMKINASTGNRVEWLLRFMSMNYYVFEVNYHELAGYLETLSDPYEWVTEIMLNIKEVLRLLHNYLASSKTLVDLTRSVIHIRLGSPDVRYEYDERVEMHFGDDPLSGFVQDLRNYLLHRELPLVWPRPRFKLDNKGEMQDFSVKLTLRKRKLLTWDRWSDRAQRFLDEHDDDIELNQVVDEYYSQISAFHSWLHLAIRDEFEDELQQLEKLHLEWNSILSYPWNDSSNSEDSS